MFVKIIALILCSGTGLFFSLMSYTIAFYFKVEAEESGKETILFASLSYLGSAICIVWLLAFIALIVFLVKESKYFRHACWTILLLPLTTLLITLFSSVTNF
ncbi:MAG: hypothetical protein HRT94_05185 [Alphaproteobacteria bacterium]|nr:hypothetical protein [Alphaproteobacteria bacterium]